MPRVLGGFDQLGEKIEQGVQTVGQSAKKSVTQTVQSTASQIKPAPGDFVKQLYGVKEESLPEQKQQKANDQPQKAADPKDVISPIPLRSEEEIKASGGNVAHPLGIALPDAGKTMSFGEQLTGQSSSEAGLSMRIDPTKEMTDEERRMLNEEQKEKRESRRQHDREYVMNNPQLDPIGSLEQQIAKVRREKEKEEQEKQQAEQEEKEQKEREEKEQQSRQLQPPRGKIRGAPNLAIDKGKKQAEIHRGTGG